MITTTITYAGIFAISIFFVYIYEKNSKENSKIKNALLIIGGIVPLILISAIRYKVGIDYDAYIINFKNIMVYFDIPYLLGFYSKEPLYVILTYIGGIIDFFNNASGMFFVYACVFVGFVFAGILNFKDKISISLAMFIFCTTYYLVSYNSIRQMIAVAIIFWNFKNIWDRKPIKYVIFTICAGMFHKTAYAMILLYLLNFKIDSKKVNKAFYILIAISPIFISYLCRLLIFMANNLEIYKSYTNMIEKIDVKFLLYVIPVLLFITINRKKILEIDYRNEILFRILYLQIPAQLLGCYISYADRMAVYFGIFQIIIVPQILNINFNIKSDRFNKNNLSIINEKNFLTIILNKCNNKKNLKIIIIIWYIFYFTIMYIVLNSNGVYPYQTILTRNVKVF